MFLRLQITKNFGSIKIIIVQKREKNAMFGSLLETEDEGEYARDNSGQDFANCDLRTEVENANLRSEESGSFFHVNSPLQT